MTLDEAISRLEIFVKNASEVAPELLDDAIRLGIEALKDKRYRRVTLYPFNQDLLPGETK